MTRSKDWRIVGDVVEIGVTRRCGTSHTILLDLADYDLARTSTTWNVIDQGIRYYARGRIGGRVVRMHQLFLPDAGEVDHINHDGLDNRRCNLRPVTHTQNMRNRRTQSRKTSTPYKGVFLEGGRYWRARIHSDGRTISLGSFPTAEAAAAAYDRAATELWGEYAYLNNAALA